MHMAAPKSTSLGSNTPLLLSVSAFRLVHRIVDWQSFSRFESKTLVLINQGVMMLIRLTHYTGPEYTGPEPRLLINVNYIRAILPAPILPLEPGCTVRVGSESIVVRESFDQVQKLVEKAFENSRAAVFE
jgi:hypothetical protein